MGAQPDSVAGFSGEYGRLRAAHACARQGAEAVPESILQALWYDQGFPRDALATREGHRLRVVSPGWWNRGPGPDFQGAQLEFNGTLHNGDVEIHPNAADWEAHGHHLDARYDGVILHVVLRGDARARPCCTSQGRRIATLVLEAVLGEAADALRDRADDDSPYLAAPQAGRCAALIPRQGLGPLEAFLDLAGEWRMLNKARALRERAARTGWDQAVYEALLYGCGFGHFKHHFQAIARTLPYDRARQLALDDALLLEAALLHLGGLMPDSLPEDAGAAPHHARLRALRRDRLEGLRSLPLTWKRAGVRPANYPERRLAGAARVVARTAPQGLAAALDAVWREDLAPVARRRRFEALFPQSSEGFWASHCTWTGNRLSRPSAPIGADRVRAIVGNVFVPAALAAAREARDRAREESVYAFLAALPAEPGNRVLRVMLPRLLDGAPGLKLNFRRQQGILQMHADWCEPNPSCRNCALYAYLDRTAPAPETAP